MTGIPAQLNAYNLFAYTYVPKGNPRPIRVSQFTALQGNVYAERFKDALYYDEENVIMVEGDKVPHTVTLNPHYGQDNDMKSKYRYRADDYFFDL